MVGHPDRIKAGFLQDADLARLCVLIGRCPDDAAVMMDACAAELHAFSVHPKSPGGIEGQSADTKAGLCPVKFLRSLAETAFQLIEDGRIFRPKTGLFDENALSQHFLFAGFKEENSAFISGTGAVRCVDLSAQLKCPGMKGFIDDRGFYAEYGILFVSAFRRDTGHVRLQVDRA